MTFILITWSHDTIILDYWAKKSILLKLKKK